VAAKCSIWTVAPTDSSLGSRYGRKASRAACSIRLIMAGVEKTTAPDGCPFPKWITSAAVTIVLNSPVGKSWFHSWQTSSSNSRVRPVGQKRSHGRRMCHNRQDFTAATVPNPSKHTNWRFLFRVPRYNPRLLRRTVASVEKEDDRRFCPPPASVLLLTACIAESKIAKPGDVSMASSRLLGFQVSRSRDSAHFNQTVGCLAFGLAEIFPVAQFATARDLFWRVSKPRKGRR
jgi:hypothetical protein